MLFNGPDVRRTSASLSLFRSTFHGLILRDFGPSIFLKYLRPMFASMGILGVEA